MLEIDHSSPQIRPEPEGPKSPSSPSRGPSRPEVWDEVLEGIFEDRSYSWDSQISFRGGSSSRTQAQIVAWSLAALGIDLLACLGLWLGALFFLRVFHFPVSFSWNQADVVLGSGLALTLLMTYMISFRAFLNFTPGEWACHLRLVPVNKGMSYGDYLLRVIARSVLVLVTGGIMFPLMILLFKVDFAEKITGLKVSSSK